MGSIKRDLYKSTQPYKHITLSDVMVIKGLIINRNKLDKFWCMKQNYQYDEAGDLEQFNDELDCLYIDLDALIKRVKLTDKQRSVLTKVMENGWYEDLPDAEAVQIYGENTSSIDFIIDRISLRIKQLNDEQWKDIIYLNHKKVTWNYKKCSQCGEYKPMTEEFYGKDDRNRDGFKSYCKDCD